MKRTFKSACLQVDMDDDCVVCRYVRGDVITYAQLQEVLKIVDSQLAETEASERFLLKHSTIGLNLTALARGVEEGQKIHGGQHK